MMAGFCTRVFWLKAAIIFFGTCGVFLMTGNYKTYVKNTISNDEMLTVVGVVGSIGNGISRYLLPYSDSSGACFSTIQATASPSS